MSIIRVAIIIALCLVYGSCSQTEEPTVIYQSYFDGDYSYDSQTEHLELTIDNKVVKDKTVGLIYNPEMQILTLNLHNIISNNNCITIENIKVEFNEETFAGEFRGSLELSKNSVLEYIGYLSTEAAFSMYKNLILELHIKNNLS